MLYEKTFPSRVLRAMGITTHTYGHTSLSIYLHILSNNRMQLRMLSVLDLYFQHKLSHLNQILETFTTCLHSCKYECFDYNNKKSSKCSWGENTHAYSHVHFDLANKFVILHSGCLSDHQDIFNLSPSFLLFPSTLLHWVYWKRIKYKSQIKKHCNVFEDFCIFQGKQNPLGSRRVNSLMQCFSVLDFFLNPSLPVFIQRTQPFLTSLVGL